MDAEMRSAVRTGKYKKMADLSDRLCDFHSGYSVFDTFAARTFSMGQRPDGTQLFFRLAGYHLE